MACCIFKNCFNRPLPHSNITFFNLPKDSSRRQQWLQRSGNEEVQNLPLTARRLVCEAHFEERHLRRQFHRTTLSRDAVPVSYSTVLDFQLELRTREGQQQRNDSGEGLELVEVDATNTDLNVQEVPTESGQENVQCERVETEEYLLEELELSVELRHKDTSIRNSYATISTQTDDPETPDQSPPSKKFKFEHTTRPTTDQATNTEPLETVESVPVESPKKSSTTERSSQTDEREPPPNPTVQKTEDEYFMFSLIEPLQRLPPEKRAIAKVKMLTYLVQLGCGMGDAQL